MRRLDDDVGSNVGATPEVIEVNRGQLQSMMGGQVQRGEGQGPSLTFEGSGGQNEAQGPLHVEGQVRGSPLCAINVSLSCSVENLQEAGVAQETTLENESVIRTQGEFGNTLNVSTKFIPSARSFESALGNEGLRPGYNQEEAKQFFTNTAYSFESTLPRYRSFDHNLHQTTDIRIVEPMSPDKDDQNFKKSKLQSQDSAASDFGGNILAIPVNHDTRRRHSFGGNEEKLESSFFAMRHSNSGDEPRRKQVLRKQIAIDVEDPLRSDSPGKLSPRNITVSAEEEKRVLSHYNIDSLTKNFNQHQHVTVIRSTPSVNDKHSLKTHKQFSQQKSQFQNSNHSVGSHDSRFPLRGLSQDVQCFKPAINIISHENQPQYLEPHRDAFRIGRGFSSGSEDSPGPSSREPSPFRKETLRSISPYSKERFKLSTPTPVIKTQVKKEAFEIPYELNKQSSSGSSDAGSGGSTFPEFANIVITSETGETVKCKSEDFSTFEVPEGMHRRHVHPGNFKKHLHARYLKSLRSRYSSTSSTDTSQEHLSQERSADSFRSSSDVFDSTENEASRDRDIYLRPPFTNKGSSETSDDNDVTMETVIKSLHGRHGNVNHSSDQQPLDLSQSVSQDTSQNMGHEPVYINKPTISVDSPSKLRPSVRQGLSPHGLAARSHLGMFLFV